MVNQFDGILADPRVRYFGNVEAGKHVALPKLRDMYHAVSFLGAPFEQQSRGSSGSHEADNRAVQGEGLLLSSANVGDGVMILLLLLLLGTGGARVWDGG